MIDIHSHIVFDVDDGPKTIEDSKLLIEESYRQGVRTIVSTSHRRKGMFETPEEKIYQNYLAVKEMVATYLPEMTLHFGAEIYYTRDILEKLEAGTIPTLAETSFALIEFSMATPYKEIYQALSAVLRLGVTPVVAHIERYHCLEKNEKRVRELIRMGCYTQINSSSVLKPKLFGDRYKFMKHRAQYFLDKDLVHFVASDMHNVDQRPPYMEKAYQLIEKRYGSNRARALFIENQQALLDNELF